MIDRIARYLGFVRLADALHDRFDRVPSIPPSYLLVATGLILQFGVVEPCNYAVVDKNSIANDPGRLLVGIGTVLAIVGTRWIRDTHAQVITDLQLAERGLNDSDDITLQLQDIVPLRARTGMYFVGVVLFYFNVFVVVGFSALVEIEGVVSAVIGNFVIIPLIQVPLIVESGLLYLGIHLVLPRRIDQADLNLFFYDPRNMGGFGSIGQLLKRSYYLYTGGLLIYFAVAYWPLILSEVLDVSLSYVEPGVTTAVFFSLAWFVGVLSIAYSMYRMHVLMSRKRDRAIRKVEAEIKALLDEPYDITVDHIDDPDTRAEFEHKIAKIRATKRYPSTFTMWSQIAISVLLPQGL